MASTMSSAIACAVGVQRAQLAIRVGEYAADLVEVWIRAVITPELSNPRYRGSTTGQRRDAQRGPRR